MPAHFDFHRVFGGKRVLITGGLGFIGSNLARTLVKFGARVSIVDSLKPEYGGNRRNLAGIAKKVRVHVADVRDWPRLPRLVRRAYWRVEYTVRLDARPFERCGYFIEAPRSALSRYGAPRARVWGLRNG